MMNLAPTASTALTLITATLILIVGVVDDLRARKFHNWLFLSCSGLALIVSFIAGGPSSLYLGAMGFGAGIAALLPLVLMKMVGAGDMKLLAAFGIVAGHEAVFWVAIASLFWGAIFGVIRVVANGQARMLVMNMVSIATLKKGTQLELHRMPYTVALLMGWLSFLVQTRVL